MNYHVLEVLPPGVEVLDGGGLTSPRDSGKLRSTLKIHEGGPKLTGEERLRRTTKAKVEHLEADSQKAVHEAEQARRAATVDDVAMTVHLALRALDRVTNTDALQAWKHKHSARLGKLRPRIAEYLSDVHADLPWEKAREEYRDILFAARDTYQRPA